MIWGVRVVSVFLSNSQQESTFTPSHIKLEESKSHLQFDLKRNVTLVFPSAFNLFSPSWQDDYVEALSRLHLTVTRAYKVNPDINFEVFIHKVDGLSDDHKIEKQRDIHKRANDDLADAGLERIHLRWVFSFTVWVDVMET